MMMVNDVTTARETGDANHWRALKMWHDSTLGNTAMVNNP
jgi:hypothetical protein